MTSTDVGPRLTPTDCAICGPGVPATVLYPANFEPADLSPETFSARRIPDRIHYQLVRCDRCQLVRSDPTVDAESLARLYQASAFDYGSEIDSLRSTYGRYLERLGKLDPAQQTLLEVGSGNGFLLEEAIRHGFTTVRGVEPSMSAVESANPAIRPSLICGVMRPGLFPKGMFDAVCMFQTFDHLPDPGGVLDASHNALRSGGLLLLLNHNVAAASARILRERSPIIDVEHTFLYRPATLKQIVEDHGFTVVEAGPVSNTISLSYLVHLLPFPVRVRTGVQRLLRTSRLSGVQVRLPLGNQYVIARRP